MAQEARAGRVMPFVKVHHHACATCRKKTECGGSWEENYDGEPAVICREYHLTNRTINPEFLCERCYLAAEQASA